jgi:hypothetical protein
MKRFTGRDLLIAGAVLVLPGLVFLLMKAMFATEPAIVADPLDWVGPQSRLGPDRIAANEAAVLEDIRKVIAGQAAYRAVNHGFYDGRLDCLLSPERCIFPYPPTAAPAFLDSRLASLNAASGYLRSFTAGPELPSPGVSVSGHASASSVTTYRYDAWPRIVGHDGVRAFAADATGRICFTSGGTPVSPVSQGKLDPSCSTLELIEPKVPSDAPTAPPTP